MTINNMIGGIAMKRVLVGIMAALVLAAGTTSTFATTTQMTAAEATATEAATSEIGRNFTDVNGDGVCDNAVTSLRYVDTDGDGVCDNLGTYQRSGANGNGGNSVNNNASSGNGQGKNFANNNAGSGSGRNYTDADGDGVCDYYNGCHGAGRGNGFQHGRNR